MKIVSKARNIHGRLEDIELDVEYIYELVKMTLSPRDDDDMEARAKAMDEITKARGHIEEAQRWLGAIVFRDRVKEKK